MHLVAWLAVAGLEQHGKGLATGLAPQVERRRHQERLVIVASAGHRDVGGEMSPSVCRLPSIFAATWSSAAENRLGGR